jgi:hypothetical protein
VPDAFVSERLAILPHAWAAAAAVVELLGKTREIELTYPA